MIQDVVDHVVDFLWNDTNTLKSCSLVSSSWSSAATYHLFNTMLLDPCLFIAPLDQSHNMRPAYFDLKNCPRIVKTVKHLRLDAHWFPRLSSRHVPDFSSTHRVVHIGSTFVDILGDVLALFTHLRCLNINQANGVLPSVHDVFPHLDLVLARPAPVNLDTLTIRMAAGQPSWILVYRALLKCFGTINSLHLTDPGPYLCNEPMEIPAASSNDAAVSHTVSKLSIDLAYSYDYPDLLYLEGILYQYVNLANVATLAITFRTYFAQALDRLAAVLAQTVNISTLTIKFMDHTLDDYLAQDQTPGIFDSVTRSLAGLAVLRSFSMRIHLSLYDLDTLSDIERATAISANNDILAACRRLASATPHVSDVRIALADWYLRVDRASPNFEALDRAPLDELWRRRGALATISVVHLPCDDEEMHARAAKVVCDNLSDAGSL